MNSASLTRLAKSMLLNTTVVTLLSTPDLCARNAFSVAMAVEKNQARSEVESKPQLQEPLVFIPGLKGSILVNSAGDKIWLSALQALGLSTPELSLPLLWNQKIQQSDHAKATEVFSEVSVVPGVWKQDLYGPWLKAAQQMSSRFSTFAYDWRRDNNETLALFIAELEAVKQRNSGKPARVVAHSMGGLIAFAALGQRPDLIKCLVLAGVPMHGGIGFLEDLHAGNKDGLNSRIASPNVLASFPSAYSFFALDNHRLIEKDGEEISADMYDPNTWRRLALGQYAQPSPLSAEQFEPFFKTALAQAKEFRSKLPVAPPPKSGEKNSADTWKEFAKIHVVASKAYSTLSKMMRGGPRSVLGWDFISAPRVPGDGRVAFEDSFPPAAFNFTTSITSAEHSQLLNDKNVLSDVQLFLNSCDSPRL